MKIITLTLSPAIDIHCHTDSFIAEHENFAETSSKDAGGKGINISRALLAGGCDSLAVVAVGKENGASFLASLDADGLNTAAVETDGQIRENITIHPKNGKETRLSFSGFSADDSIVDKIEQITKQNAASGDIVALAGSLPAGITKSRIKTFVKSLKAQGIKVVIDSRSFTSDDIIEYAPFLIKPNEQEISAYTDTVINGLEDASNIAVEIQRQGVENVMVSLGAKGAVLASSDGVFTAEAPQITAVSTIGAGDSSIAGFLSAYSSDNNYGECLKIAVAYGSAACMTEGTKPPQKEDIEYLSKAIRINKL